MDRGTTTALLTGLVFSQSSKIIFQRLYIYMFLETPFDLLFRSPIVTDKFFLNERREKFRRNEIRKGGKKEAGKKIRDEKKKGWERGSVVLFIGRRERLMS